MQPASIFVKTDAFTGRNLWRSIIFVFLFTALVRGIIAFYMPLHPVNPDFAEYSHLAQHFWETGNYGFRTDWRQDPRLARSRWRFCYDDHGAMRPPGYSMYLVAFSATTGINLRAVVLSTALICALNAALICYLGTVVFGRVPGIIAAALYALNPGELWAMGWIGRDQILTLFNLGIVCLLLRLSSSPSWRISILAGLWIGLSAYFKETTAFFGAIMIGWVVFTRRGGSTVALKAFVALVIAGCCVLPWTIRNYFYYHRVVPMAITSGYNMWVGLTRDHTCEMEPFLGKEDAVRLNPFREAANGVEADARLNQASVIYGKEHPYSAMFAFIRNAAVFWSPVSNTVLNDGFRSDRYGELLSLIFYLVVDITALVAAYSYRHRWETWLLFTALVAVTAVHSLFVPYPRFRMPYDFVLFIWGPALISYWLERLSVRRSSKL